MEDLEREYSPSSRVGGSADPFVADYVARSAAARAALGDRIAEVDGGSLAISAGVGTPLLVFIHGGYWQALSAEASLYLAPRALSRGWSFAALEYTLAPGAPITQMVTECRQGLAKLAGHVAPSAVVLVGHSAGAHLAAMISLVRPSPLPIVRTVLLSGVFDLRPLVRTSVNDALGLDVPSAAAISPLLLPVGARPQVVVAVGDNDTDAFRQQSSAYAAHLQSAGVAVMSTVCPRTHHFDIVDQVLDPFSELGNLTLGGVA